MSRPPAASVRMPLDALLEELDRRRIPYRVRKERRVGRVATELDLGSTPDRMRELEAALTARGFRYLRAPGRGSHRFFLVHDRGRWYKVDLKLSEPASRRDGFVGTRLGRALLRRVPLGVRRLGPLVGIDGSATAARELAMELAAELPVAVSVVGVDQPTPRFDQLTRSEVLRGWQSAWRGNVVLVAPRGRPGEPHAFWRRLDTVYRMNSEEAPTREEHLREAAASVWEALSERRGWERRGAPFTLPADGCGRSA